MNKQNLISKLSKTDNFPVNWAGRNNKGDLSLTSDVFRVTTTPSPLFGYNVRDFGAEYAERVQELAGNTPEHDFGACFIKDKSLRKVNGRWCVDLSVDPTMCRFFNVRKMRVQTDEAGNEDLDENGESKPLLDENGEVQTSLSRQKESFITVELGMIEPDVDHVLSTPYVQSDSRTKAHLGRKERSEKAANREKVAKAKAQGKNSRVKLTNAQMEAKIASLASA